VRKQFFPSGFLSESFFRSLDIPSFLRMDAGKRDVQCNDVPNSAALAPPPFIPSLGDSLLVSSSIQASR